MANLNRRSVLQAGAVAALMPAVPVMALSALPSSAGIDDAIARFREAEASSNAWHAAVFDPAHAAYEAAWEALPHYTTKASFVSRDGSVIHMSTTCDTAKAVVDSFRERGWKFADDDYGRCSAEIAEAFDHRTVRRDELLAEHRIWELNAESDRQTDMKVAALYAVEIYPVQSLVDMIKKIELLNSEELNEYLHQDIVLADVKRIAGGS